MKVWVISDEGRIGRIEDGEGLSFIGVFSTKEEALDYLREQVLGDELLSSIEWEGSKYNPEYFEGFDSRGNRYILATTEVDDP